MAVTHDITKEQYIDNPCGTCSTAFWKNSYFEKPSGVQIVHESKLESVGQNEFDITKYFRLSHDLLEIELPNLCDDYYFQTVDIETQKEAISAFINCCYEDMYITPEQVNEWVKYKVFDNDLWVFIFERKSILPIALGIADFDADIKEGSFEWIQVLPQKRGQALGKAVVNELLFRLKSKAKFVTVSGQTDNETNPEALYRKCGFDGGDIWCVVSPK